MIDVVGCMVQEHDLRLVALAVCICAIACYTTLSILTRIELSPGQSGRWLLVASATFGGGVWSLHFVSMLAFLPGLPIAYDIQVTIASVVIVVCGAWVGFLLWLRVPGWRGVVAGGTVLGLSVSGMHYVGVAAMRLPGSLSFDRGLVAASVLVSVGLATLGLARASSLVMMRRRIEVGLWLALSICGLHFTGMAALRVTPGGVTVPNEAVLGSGTLAATVGVVSIALLVVSLAATLMEQRLSRRAVEELRRMRVLSNISQEVMIIHRDGRVLEANTAGARMFGLSVEELRGHPVLELMAEASVPLVVRRERCPPEDRRPEEMEVRAQGGRIVPVELSCSIIEYDGGPATAMVLRDLTDRKRDAARIRHLALHDALTDLPNRFLLQEQLRRTLNEAARRGTGVALLHLDLDRFKPVNDLLGHSAGDALLVQVVRRFTAELRPGDMLARIGGDEFVVVCTDAEQPTHAATLAAALAARLIEAAVRPFEVESLTIEIGVSVGVAVFPADGGTEAALLHAADTALYRAKEEQRGTFRMFEPRMDERLRERRQLEHDLRHAVERGELVVHYQPILSCRTGKVEGFEALVRWDHPVRGQLPPLEFIPLAEETGLIVGIGEWVLGEACAAASGWPSPLWVAVNVSPAQFGGANLPATVATALARSGLAADRLEVEVTEGVLIEDSARALAVLGSLRALGVRISLDDFGTGFSSLSYLRSFAFDKLKIDKSFMAGMENGGEAATIVRAITGLGHSLGLSVTVEGVETARQLELIRAQGCDTAQGWLIGRPGPGDALARFWTSSLVAAE